MHYRTEIDGLRAVAVIPVILFHAGFQTFSGGFVGVDIFFVISGYLITSVILSEMDEGKFSLINFYERRSRRILPALFFVMVACIPFAWMWLMPNDMKDFSQSLVAVTTFSSNILFLRESGYFDTSAELKPLLHTWSLAVEEQYYILFPLFLMLTWRLGKRWILISLVVLAIVSLGVAHWGAYNKPAATFYLLPTRGWEILIGAFPAFYFNGNGRKSFSSTQNQFGSFIGLILIAFSIFAYNDKTPFPSLYAIAPTVGAVLLILFSQKGTVAYCFLSNRLMVGVGLLSYSAYLWHQPLFAFAKHHISNNLSGLVMALLCAFTLPLAYLSWRFVEKPFRQKSQIRRAVVFSLSAAFAFAFIGLGLSGHIDKGNFWRFDAQLISKVEASRLSENKKREVCRTDTGKLFEIPNEQCWYGKGDFKILVWGDSHNDTTAYTLSQRLPNTRIYHAAYESCPPVFGIVRVDNRTSKCAEFNQRVFEWLKTEKFDAVVLSARWRVYAEGTKFDNGEGGVENYSTSFSSTDNFTNEEERFFSVVNAYKKSIEVISKQVLPSKVFLIYQIPEAGVIVPDAYYKAVINGEKKPLLTTSFSVYRNANKRVASFLDTIEGGNLIRIYPSKLLCDNEVPNRCILTKNGKILYIDDDHLSIEGAELLTDYYALAIEPQLKWRLHMAH